MSIPSTVLRGADLYHDRHFAIGVKTLLQNVGSGASITDRSPLGLTITKVGTVSQITSGARFGMPGFGFPNPPGDPGSAFNVNRASIVQAPPSTFRAES